MKEIAEFIHYSDTLLHIDLGGMNFTFTDISHIFQRGLRKSRTLRSCHIVGANNFGPSKFQELRQMLDSRNKFENDFGIKFNKELLKDLFAKKKQAQNQSQFFAEGLKK